MLMEPALFDTLVHGVEKELTVGGLHFCFEIIEDRSTLDWYITLFFTSTASKSP